MRVLALDIGTVRVGVAVSDPLGIIANGIDVWRVDKKWMQSLDECVKKYNPSVLLLGLPVRTTGERGVEAHKIMCLAGQLRATYPKIKVETWDERFTTVIAEKSLIEADISREKRKGKIDKIAAVLILQSWLDQQGFKV